MFCIILFLIYFIFVLSNLLCWLCSIIKPLLPATPCRHHPTDTMLLPLQLPLNSPLHHHFKSARAYQSPPSLLHTWTKSKLPNPYNHSWPAPTLPQTLSPINHYLTTIQFQQPDPPSSHPLHNHLQFPSLPPNHHGINITTTTSPSAPLPKPCTHS